MLTPRHLAIVRAALQFFDEEMSPHGPDMARPYFAEPLDEKLGIDEVRQLRELLQTTELRYLRCEETGATIPSQELMSFEQALNGKRSFRHGRLATLLLISVP